MAAFFLIIRTELVLFLRSRGVWIAGLFLLLFGVWTATTIRESPLVAWNTLGAAALLLSLLLSFLTGDQISHDYGRHIDGVLLSTPISTLTYVWGKFLAAVISLMGLAALYLVAQLLVNQFDTWRDPPFLLGHSHYPSFGLWPFLLIWLVAILIPVLFGAALTLLGTTLLHGQRILSSVPLLLLWLGPVALQHWPTWLDLTVASLSRHFSFDGNTAATRLVASWKTALPPTNTLAERVVQLAQSDFSRPFPAFFLESRLIYAGMALLLIIGTTCNVYRHRCHG